MFSEPPVVLSSHPDNPSVNNNPAPRKRPMFSKKILLLGTIIFVGLMIILGVVFLVVLKNRPAAVPDDNSPSQATGTSAVLPGSNLPTLDSEMTATTTFTDLAIEYLSFADFYVPPDNQIAAQINDYQLPLNVKIDVVNYYDISRKLNIDPGLESLNKYGFTTISNPWHKEAPDFYSVYSLLEEKQIPVLVTSDFIIYYYQSILKKAFKDIEENVFYDNLWELNKQMYTVAKNRYEARLAMIGDINDSILEGERLETLFFAVALELLKPRAEQITETGALDDKSKFVASEVDRFSFIAPPYLKDDIEAELVKIRADKKLKAKSPVLLYERDYADFTVPYDYSADAKLYNFYLTTRWLNSVWPLNYRSAQCTTCLLDREDWRINIIAASLISQDFSSLPGLKNKWARIYKTISYFKGLREDLNYVYYRDTIASTFGSDYNLEKLFDDSNQEAAANLEKLRANLLALDFPAIRGALVKDDPNLQVEVGFKMLVESYWPNDYIFSQLISPSVGNYLGAKPSAQNLVYCSKTPARCNGVALDVINLIWPISDSDYFQENTNYSGYTKAITGLQKELIDNKVWHTSDYWTNLQLIKTYLSMDRKNLPLFAHSQVWQTRSLDTAVGAWINLQLPTEKFTVNQLSGGGTNLNGLSDWRDNSYVEPNLNLVNELIANNVMVLKMFNALQLNIEIPIATQEIQVASNNLNLLKKIIVKELTGEKLNNADNEAIVDFIKQLTMEP
ncbi:MAG: DUF3160 domain-containing protein, partial [Patescibacteria group bacterium]